MNPGRKIVWTVITILILVGGGVLNGWLWFSWLPQLNEELAQEEKKWATAHAKLHGPDTSPANRDSLPSIVEDIEKFTIDLDKLKKMVPNLDRSEYDTFADELDELRKRSGVFVWKAKWLIAKKTSRSSRGLQPKIVPPKMHKVQYDLDLTGSFFQLLRFIRMLEKEQRFVNVESFAISPGTSSKSGKLVRKMDLMLYSFTYRQTDEALKIKIPKKEYSKSTEIPD